MTTVGRLRNVAGLFVICMPLCQPALLSVSRTAISFKNNGYYYLTAPQCSDSASYCYSHPFIAEHIIILDNSVKRSPEGTNQNASGEKSLSAIFDTIMNLNQMVLGDPSLCAGEHGPSFHDAFFNAARKLVKLGKGWPLRYVELGPEPIKSRAILTQMVAAGVQLRQYVGVDINPKSEKVMRQTFEPVIGTERFTYLIVDFYKCSMADCPKPRGGTGEQDGCLTVVTNLGFQEGNDLPSRTGPMLQLLTRPGDLLLSEMQVFHGSTGDRAWTGEVEAAAIERFYQLPEMRRFSALVGRRFHSGSLQEPNAASDGEQQEYLFNLVPLGTEIGSVKVAAMLVSVRMDGVKKYVLTNSCIKYTCDQFQQAREASGNFVMISSQENGDKSVVFQIAERR